MEPEQTQVEITKIDDTSYKRVEVIPSVTRETVVDPLMTLRRIDFIDSQLAVLQAEKDTLTNELGQAEKLGVSVHATTEVIETLQRI